MISSLRITLDDIYMVGRDTHNALKTEVVNKDNAGGVEFVTVKLYWGKDDIAFSLHAAPNTHSTAGLQTTDFLNYLGFQRGGCPFVSRVECFSRWVDSAVDLAAFQKAFLESYKSLQQSERHFTACGFFFEQAEGWGYFYGKPSGGKHFRMDSVGSTDGHTAPTSKRMKDTEDEGFQFVFSWMEGGSSKGWTTHYRPKHSPLSPEVLGVFSFLGLREFNDCPCFDFEPCYWRFIQHRPSAESFFNNNAETAHTWFDAHAGNFSQGIEQLLSVQARIEPFRMGFLPIVGRPEARMKAEIERRVTKPKEHDAKRKSGYDFDVAISFAGTERGDAEQLATLVRDAGFAVFYDNFYPTELWGKDLPVLFDQIYRRGSCYCVIFVSAEYGRRMWTNHERRSAQARALEEKGKEYILPIQVDGSELPGMPSTVGYLSITEYGIEKIAAILIKKLEGSCL